MQVDTQNLQLQCLIHYASVTVYCNLQKSAQGLRSVLFWQSTECAVDVLEREAPVTEV
jgi:hypothetical protein